MRAIYTNILNSISRKERLLAILLDPDKVEQDAIEPLMIKINNSKATHIFVGGSTVENGQTDGLVAKLKTLTQLPVILFPGDINQITDAADGLLYLSLISGRDPEYLIEKQVQAVSELRDSSLEIIPTGYLLIENGKTTTVQKVTSTTPMLKQDVQQIVDTAKAGELLGMKLIYLEAGSGAITPIDAHIISKVKVDLKVPLIVGGGIRSNDQLETAFRSGADLVVIGTAFEEDTNVLNELI